MIVKSEPPGTLRGAKNLGVIELGQYQKLRIAKVHVVTQVWKPDEEDKE